MENSSSLNATIIMLNNTCKYAVMLAEDLNYDTDNVTINSVHDTSDINKNLTNILLNLKQILTNINSPTSIYSSDISTNKSVSNEMRSESDIREMITFITMVTDQKIENGPFYEMKITISKFSYEMLKSMDICSGSICYLCQLCDQRFLSETTWLSHCESESHINYKNIFKNILILNERYKIRENSNMYHNIKKCNLVIYGYTTFVEPYIKFHDDIHTKGNSFNNILDEWNIEIPKDPQRIFKDASIFDLIINGRFSSQTSELTNKLNNAKVSSKNKRKKSSKKTKLLEIKENHLKKLNETDANKNITQFERINQSLKETKQKENTNIVSSEPSNVSVSNEFVELSVTNSRFTKIEVGINYYPSGCLKKEKVFKITQQFLQLTEAIKLNPKLFETCYCMLCDNIVDDLHHSIHDETANNKFTSYSCGSCKNKIFYFTGIGDILMFKKFHNIYVHVSSNINFTRLIETPKN